MRPARELLLQSHAYREMCLHVDVLIDRVGRLHILLSALLFWHTLFRQILYFSTVGGKPSQVSRRDNHCSPARLTARSR